MLYKVNVGSSMYKEGIRWTETFQPSGQWPMLSHCMVTDFILTTSMIILMIFMYHLVALDQGRPGDVDHVDHISGAWSHKLQQDRPAGIKLEPAQHGRGGNHTVSKTNRDPQALR